MSINRKRSLLQLVNVEIIKLDHHIIIFFVETWQNIWCLTNLGGFFFLFLLFFNLGFNVNKKTRGAGRDREEVWYLIPERQGKARQVN